MGLPERYGPKSTAHDRLKAWEMNEVWKRVMKAAIASGYASSLIRNSI